MSSSPSPKPPAEPSRRELLKPVELLVFAAILGVFVGLIVLATTRELWLSGESAGGVFIVSLVGIALFVQSAKPSKDELNELHELDAAHGGTLPYLVARERRADAKAGINPSETAASGTDGTSRSESADTETSKPIDDAGERG